MTTAKFTRLTQDDLSSYTWFYTAKMRRLTQRKMNYWIGSSLLVSKISVSYQGTHFKNELIARIRKKQDIIQLNLDPLSLVKLYGRGGM